MNKFFKLSFLLLFFNQIIFCDQEYPKKMLLADSDVDIELLKSQYCAEGFLQGTLVETMKGYVPIEEIEIGDYLLGLEGVQEVLSVKKDKVNWYVRLLMSNDEYVYAAMHQDFYLDDKTLFPAAGLGIGSRLLNGMYVVDNEFIDEPCSCYSLTTEHHAFFIYPETLVHNFNPVVIGVLGSYVIGTVEVANVVNVMLGAIASLSWYATQYFRSKIVYNYEFSEEESKLTVEQLCLQNVEVVQQTRHYFDIKRRALNSLDQDLIKIKNDLFVFVKSNYNCAFDFSFGLLSQYKSAQYNLLGLMPLASEMALSLTDKEKLMKMRQVELDTLQQDIFDMHLTLVLHITELIDRRDLATQQLRDIRDQVDAEVIVWNSYKQNRPINIAISHYKTLFNWLEMLDNLEFKIKELTCVMSYYQKLKSHFFMTKTTNFIDVFNKQAIINKAHLEEIVKDRASWFSNIKITEDFLRGKNSLTNQFVDQCKLAGKQYRAERDKNPIIFAQKRNDDIKKQFSKESEAKKKGGGGGPEDPEQDPEDPDEVLGFFKNSLTHGFKKEDGHIPLDSLENRKWILDMAKKAKNYLGKDRLRGNHWYAEILKDGRQLWASVRDRYIRNFGLNETPALFDVETGLCRNILKK